MYQHKHLKEQETEMTKWASLEEKGQNPHITANMGRGIFL